MKHYRCPSAARIVSIAALAVILGFGLMLRYQAFAQSGVGHYPHGDAAKYLLYAYNLKNFGVYGISDMTLRPANMDLREAREQIKPDALVTPGLPIFISLFIGGEYTEDQRDAVRMAQVVISALTILLAYAVFVRFGQLYGLAVAALTALSPHLVHMNLFLLTEPLFCFLVIASLFVLSVVRSDSSPPVLILFGLVLAMATMTRPWIQGYLFIIMAYLVMSRMRMPKRRVLLILVGAALITAPWLIRNSVSLGAAADPRLSVRSIHHGMYPGMMYEGQADTLGFAYDADPMSAELSESLDTTLSELRRRAGEKPLEYASWFLVGKTRMVLSWSMIAAAAPTLVYPVQNSPYYALPSFYLTRYYMEKIHGLLMFLALVGVVVVWLPEKYQPFSDQRLFLARAVSLLVLYFVLMHNIGAPYPRYSIPLRPILYGMSLYPLLILYRQMSGGTGPVQRILSRLRR